MKLGAQAAARDAATFVAREGELAVLAGLLAPTSPHRIAVVTGAAGAGKTAVVREAARRCGSGGYVTLWFDARERRIGRDLAQVVLEAASLSAVVLVIDSAEELGADEAWLRDTGLAGLSDRARVVLISRRPLQAAWWGSPWAASIVAVTVGPLESGGGAAFLAARGLRDAAEVSTVLAWAEGHALSLTLAAAVRGARGRALGLTDLAALETDLLDQLTGGRLDGPTVLGRDRLVLAVAALAPAVDASLLGAVLPALLPGQDAQSAERWLRGLPFAERLGHRVTLHQRVRRLLATQLRSAEPHVERDLRVRIIDHFTRERAGHPGLVIDVREVLAPPQDRGVTPSLALASSWTCESAQPADEAEVAALLAGQDPVYVAWVLEWVRAAPEQVLVARRHGSDRALVAVALWVTDACDVADVVVVGAAPVLGAWRAAASGWSSGVLYNPVTEIVVPELDRPEVTALVLTSLVRACGLADFRRWVALRKPSAPDPLHCGGVADARFDVTFGALTLPGYVIDYGPEGVVAAMRDEAQAALDARVRAPVTDLVSDPLGVRDVLRHFHDPVWLAGSALACGSDPVERAASVQTLLRDATEQAFGDGPDARLQREVLQLGYLDPEANHARAMRALHLSRTTYFRRLREATARLAAWLAVRA